MKHGPKLLLLWFLCQLPLAAAWSQGDEDSGPVRCVQLTRIDRTEVLDETTIVFYMRGRDIYLNHLPRTCPRLDHEKRFSYTAATGRLCNVDSISVIENGAFGFSRGATCRLGMFVPTNEEVIALLKGEEQEAEVTVVPVEVDE